MDNSWLKSVQTVWWGIGSDWCHYYQVKGTIDYKSPIETELRN